ncbi:DUF11 domain-containing protein [Streptomyces sp. ISL-43]|nr:isopeptide-forming domain-containing fimbrial protein [Streptomyces sp. ISL-43]MBT2446580.1 DUF11 domain-containing protein [Streptomyces sp. ISL-43]
MPGPPPGPRPPPHSLPWPLFHSARSPRPVAAAGCRRELLELEQAHPDHLLGRAGHARGLGSGYHPSGRSAGRHVQVNCGPGYSTCALSPHISCAAHQRARPWAAYSDRWNTGPRPARRGPHNTPAGAVTEFPIPGGGAPTGIAAGPDGALWFTEFGGEKIGRITTAGAISEYPIPTTSGQPEEITAGPDDSLWFTERNSGKIGRISTAGVIAEFPLPSSESGPWGITTGPDGDIWFAETAGRIGRLDLTEADLGVAKSDTGSDPVEVGQSVTYTLTATNNGPQTAEGVVLKDTLPAGLQFASASAGCTASGTTPDVVTCELGTLTAGSTAIRTITTTATTAGLHTDTAAVAGAVSDPVPANDLAPETTTVDPDTCFGEQPTITGTPGDDQITGTPQRDVILARAGNDTVNGGGRQRPHLRRSRRGHGHRRRRQRPDLRRCRQRHPARPGRRRHHDGRRRRRRPVR